MVLRELDVDVVVALERTQQVGVERGARRLSRILVLRQQQRADVNLVVVDGTAVLRRRKDIIGMLADDPTAASGSSRPAGCRRC